MESSRSYIKATIAVFLGVYLALAAYDITKLLLAAWTFNEFVKELGLKSNQEPVAKASPFESEAFKIDPRIQSQTAEIERMRKDIARYQQQESLEQKRLQEARKTNDRVCAFWQSEYQVKKNDYEKSMMDLACQRAATD